MKVFNLKKALIAFVFAAVYVNASYAQQNYWTLPPSKWNVQVTTPTATSFTGSQSQYVNSNGAYDQNGNLLFYIKDNQVSNATGSWGGVLLPYYKYGSPATPANENNFTFIGSEISIVPVPGSCKQFYIIYTMGNGLSPSYYLLYMKIDVSGATPVLSSPTATSLPYMPINAINADVLMGTGIAVSKLVGGSTRYLFAGGRNAIERFTISSTGINSGMTISNSTAEPTLFSGLQNRSDELELSPDQQWLSWGNTALAKICLLKLNASYTKVAGASKTFTQAEVNGVEFNASSTRIYVTSNTAAPDNGIRFVNFLTLTNNGSPTSISGGTILPNSFLELAKNGKIYGVSNTGQLIGVTDATTPAINLAITSPLVYSNGTNLGLQNDISYRLSDQIDGENYNYFFGVSPSTSDFTINSAPVSTNCAAPTQLYNCVGSALTMNNQSTNATQYKLEVYKSITTCGAYSFVHSTGIVSTFPSDLKNLPGGATGTYLASNAGAYTLMLSTYNSCNLETLSFKSITITAPLNASSAFKTNVITKAGQTLVIGSCAVPQNTQLTYQDGAINCGGTNGYKFLMEHSSPTTPNEVGRLNTVFDLSGITAGTGSSIFQVRVKADKWDASTSTWVSMDSNPNGETITGATSLSLVGLVAYDPLSPWFEAFTNSALTPNGSVYRVTIYVDNSCGTISTSQIIKLNTLQLKSAGIASNSETVNDTPIRCYPNPFSDEITFSVQSTKGDRVSIEIMDVSGRKIKTVTENTAVSEETAFTTNLNEMEAGTYFYKVSINENESTGKIMKK